MAQGTSSTATGAVLRTPPALFRYIVFFGMIFVAVFLLAFSLKMATGIKLAQIFPVLAASLLTALKFVGENDRTMNRKEKWVIIFGSSIVAILFAGFMSLAALYYASVQAPDSNAALMWDALQNKPEAQSFFMGSLMVYFLWVAVCYLIVTHNKIIKLLPFEDIKTKMTKMKMIRVIT